MSVLIVPGNDEARQTSHVELFREGLRRFLEKARAAVDSNHQNLLWVREVFEENGTGYMVLDLFWGSTLEEEFTGGRLPWGETLGNIRPISEARTLGIMRPVLEGLRMMHAQGQLHLEIMPVNIHMVARKGPVLLDSGQRLPLDLASFLKPDFARTEYAAPEQLSCRGCRQGPWTDIYACSAILYQMLSGQKPPHANSRQLGEETLRPLAEIVPGVSARVSDAVQRGLAIEPGDRPQSVDDFLRLLGVEPEDGNGTVWPPGDPATFEPFGEPGDGEWSAEPTAWPDDSVGHEPSLPPYETVGTPLSEEDIAALTPELEKWGAETRHREEAAAAPAREDEPEETALMHAAMHGTPEEVSSLLAAGADVHAKVADGKTALMYAAERNPNPGVVRALLDAGAEVDATGGEYGQTALMFAAEHNLNADVVMTLLAAGADLNARNTGGGTALMEAAENNMNPGVVRALLAAGADVNARMPKNGGTALMAASAGQGNPSVIMALLEAGAEVDARFKDGRTALMLAAQRNRYPAVFRALLAAGADVNARDENGGTALMAAARHNGDPDVVKKLLEAGADVNARYKNGQTALMLAAGNILIPEEVIRALLAAGADLNAKDKDGDTALDWAKEADHTEAIELLRAAAAQADGRSGGRPGPSPTADAPNAATLQPGKTLSVALGRNVTMEFVEIPAGKFWMGSGDGEKFARDDEKPRHEVTISRPFYLGKHPVTQAQWEAVMGRGLFGFGRKNPSRFKGPDHPVENVSWQDAQEFIRKLNAKEGHNRYRLPTEAEWEYACRAGGTGRYSFGDGKDELDDYAWYGSDSRDGTHPVGRKFPNCWGLHDMHGNVNEWVQDWHGKYSAEAAVNPQGPEAGDARVFRGGRWGEFARFCRSASRGSGVPRNRYDYVGFRVALSVGKQA